MNLSWNTKKIKELYDYSSGLSKSADQFGFGYPFLSYKDVFHNAYLPETLSTLVNSTEIEQEKCSIKRGDVFLTRTSETTDELGMSSVALVDYPYATYNGFTKRLRPTTNEIHPEFAAYFYRSPYFRAQIISMASLITRASLNESNLDRLKITYPNKETQIVIGNILQSYDLIINSNVKKIRLLEKMASELYKEWFVRFRFPGHETAKFVNGLPEGWEYMPLKNIMTFSRGISYSTEELSESDGYNLINLKNISAYGGFNYDGTKKFTGKYKESQIVQQGDLVIGITDMTQDRRTVGSVALIPDLDGISVISADLLKVNSMIDNIFIYCLCKFGSYSKYFSMFANGANVLHLRPDMLYSRKILIPNIDIINEFVMHISPIFEEMTLCHKKNELLSKQRDLLLPRLMSGKLSVEPLLGQTA